MIPSLKRLPRTPAFRPAKVAEEWLIDTLGDLCDTDGIYLGDVSLDRALRLADASQLPEAFESLQCRGYVAYSSEGVALMSRLSAALKREADRNRLRARRGLQAAPDWSLRQRVHDLFPQLRGKLKRPDSYKVPSAYAALLEAHAHSHFKARPSNVELLTDACYPGELTTVLTLIAEQESAGRTVHLLYTRKAVYVGVLRSPKR